MAVKGKIRGSFKNSSSVVLQQCQNQASFQRSGSGVVTKRLLNLLKGKQYCPSIREHFLPFKNTVKMFIRCQSPFFVTLLYFDITGEQ